MHSQGLLRENRDYRYLWIAKVGSLFGDWFNQVALAQITLMLTHSAASLGLVLLCRSLPSVLLGPFAGPIVDRFPKKPLLVVTDLLRTACAFGYSFAVVFHAHWILYAASLLLGVSGVFFNPARSAAVPLVVTRDDLPEANALDSGMTGLVQIVGAALGGVVAIAVSPILCFAINAASYLWSAFAIFRARWTDVQGQRVAQPSYLASLREGFREATQNRVARAIIFIGMSWGLAGGGYYVLIPLLGDEIFHRGGLGIGLLYAIDGIGVLVGSVVVRRVVAGSHHKAVVAYGVAYLTQALFFGLLAQSTVFLVGSFMLLLMRISSGVIIPLDTYLLQMSIAAGLRGRMFALHESTYGGVMQISYVLTGLAYAHLGIAQTGIIVDAMSLVCGLSWLWQFGGVAVVRLRSRGPNE